MPPEHDDDGVSTDRIRDVLSRMDAADSELIDPPEDLWSGIATAIDAPAVAPPVVLAEPGAPTSAEIVVLPTPHRSRRVLAAVAAAAVIAAAVAGGVLATRSTSPKSTVVASASLTPLEGTATARARLLRTDGHLRLQLIADGMPAAPAGEYYELWLMNRANTIPVSLGAMTGSTTVTVPDGVDTDKFPVVDISLQPNGHAEYSGHSILRGTLA